MSLNLLLGSSCLIMIVSFAWSEAPIPVRLGDFVTPLSINDLGRGFKINNNAAAESALKSHIFAKDDIQVKRMTGSSTVSSIATDLRSLKDVMEMRGSISISYGPMSGKGSGKFLSNYLSSSNQMNLIYRSRHNAFFVRLNPNNIRLCEEARKKYLNDFNSLIEDRGTKFVSTIIYGAQLEVVYTVKSSEHIDVNEIGGKMKGSIGSGKLGIDFTSQFDLNNESNNTKYNLHIDVKSSGVNFDVPANPSLEDVEDVIERFNEKYKEKFDNFKSKFTNNNNNNLQFLEEVDSIEPVSFLVENTADYESRVKKDLIDSFENKMEEVGDSFYATMFVREKLRQVNRDLDFRFGSNPKFKFEMYYGYKRKFDEIMQQIDQKIGEILEYRSSSISYILTSTVPKSFPEHEEQRKIVNGLCGEYYIPPGHVKIGSEESFNNMYYVGFALKNNEGFNPVLEGRLIDVSTVLDEPIVVYGKSPDHLSHKAVDLLKDWKRVRHVPDAKKWHPSIDQLHGNDVYGNPSDDTKPWSIRFEDAVSGYNQYLFMSGGRDKFVIMSKKSVIGVHQFAGECVDRPVLLSHEGTTNLISLENGSDCQLVDICIPNDLCLYKESGIVDGDMTDSFDVFVRKDSSGFQYYKDSYKFDSNEDLESAIEVLKGDQGKAELEYGHVSTWDYSKTSKAGLNESELLFEI